MRNDRTRHHQRSPFAHGIVVPCPRPRRKATARLTDRPWPAAAAGVPTCSSQPLTRDRSGRVPESSHAGRLPSREIQHLDAVPSVSPPPPQRRSVPRKEPGLLTYASVPSRRSPGDPQAPALPGAAVAPDRRTAPAPADRNDRRCRAGYSVRILSAHPTSEANTRRVSETCVLARQVAVEDPTGPRTRPSQTRTGTEQANVCAKVSDKGGQPTG